MSPHPVVTLLTDFGCNDEYVAVVKGVLLSYCVNLQVVDITHQIPPQNVKVAAHIFKRAYSYFPEGTIHLAVVDPGVGSSRKILAIKTSQYIFIGPDNGLFTPVIVKEKIIAIREVTASHLFLSDRSNTFHGRDIMAPVAARLAGGMDFSEVGNELEADGCNTLLLSEIQVDGKKLYGEIVYIDRFGNLCTNIDQETLLSFIENRAFEIQVGQCKIHHISSHYSLGKAGEPIALFDSHNFLEITENYGNICDNRNLKVGQQVIVILK